MQFGLALVLGAAVLAGVAQATQAVYNTAIARAVGGPFVSALISMTIAALILLTICLVTRASPPGLAELRLMTPYPLLVGGGCGAVILVSVLFATPRIGSAAVIALFILGQLMASVMIDHFGILGIPQHAVSITRIAGLAAVLGGTYLVVTG